ncbi:septum formation inhibitor Maf [Croceivirga thetidis]|uniref:Septum formation inhibitor Maf n=1 Tax=Croceivirga thetidis TaxID=2721623 RepID=A0ABX1GQ88_9FLAO|nr:septum formation inhibitor Maf [Croceivirga thetidis]NKI32078.1 septum formation inhibitor Maf [Croceivirga thetidis]
MKRWIRFELLIILFALVVVGFEGCKERTVPNKELALNTEKDNSPLEKELPKKELSKEFKEYWYAGDAEITSYKLEQARYGELREGKSVLIYVTEPFLPEIQVKADQSNPSNIPVLKLNATKKYLTGIYPYSVMSSTFYPVYDNQHAIKTTFSMQEWCGHVYAQLNNRETFEFMSHSYFEGEADQELALNKAILENEIWNKIRINPEGLPLGELEIIPSLEYFRTKHVPVQAFKAEASLKKEGDTSTYTIAYNNTQRKLSITFSSSFPYQIEGWTEEFKSGYGPSAKTLVSKGTKLKTLKTPYWRQNSNKFVALRDSLAL